MGDPSKANLWRKAFVLVSFDLDAEIPADIDADLDSDWEDVGVLTGESPSEGLSFGQNSDFFGRNGEFIDTLIDDRTDQVTFAAHEDNETVQKLRGIVDGVQYAIRPLKVLLAIEKENLGRKHRKVTPGYALVWQSGDATAPKNAPEQIPFTAKIFPSFAEEHLDEDGNPALWVVQSTDDDGS